MPEEKYYESLFLNDSNSAFAQTSLAVKSALENVKLDIIKQFFCFTNGKKFSFQEVAGQIQKKWNLKDQGLIYEYMISWMENEYLPDGVNEDNEKAMTILGDKIDIWVESL